MTGPFPRAHTVLRMTTLPTTTTTTTAAAADADAATGGAPTWTPGGWRSLPADQQPEWPDPAALAGVLARIAANPPLVFAEEVRTLTTRLAAVADGQAFVLQAGDCAESFDASADSLRDKLKVILQMAVVLTYGAGLPVVKMGRIAGQFAKPRSSPTETVAGTVIPSFRGHMVNGEAPTAEARVADPERLLQAYHQSASTMNLLRAFTKGGFADLTKVHVWNQEFVHASSEGQRYKRIANEIERALRFMAACGIDLSTEATIHQVDVWTCHEALLLGYEEALTRQDSLTGSWYDCSAHLLWVGERTRRLDGAHVSFLTGVDNPVAAKLGPSTTPEQAVGLCQVLNPARVPGRLSLITRLGADRVEEVLPPLVRAVGDAGHPVVWVCDPMHGNTVQASGGRKTRHFHDILAEIRGFFAVHRAEGSWPGGVHVELTGDDVTECLGGSSAVLDHHLSEKYTSICDPRLNARQSLDLAFEVAELLRG
ncbi:MAG: class II 3-deoxy-7-phosphoheptulonate synthase [Acidimicrobiales bacterium]